MRRDMYARLAAIFERILGPEHPFTLTADAKFAEWTERANTHG